MLRIKTRFVLFACVGIFILGSLGPATGLAYVKGIYITQGTAQSTRTMQYLIKRSKAVGINTFVIDIYYPNKRYRNNIAMVRRAGIRYVARIVIFPYGGTHAQVKNRKLWEKRWRRAQYAIAMGASEIQLDYIRYRKTTRPSDQNAKNVYEVIKFFRNRMRGTGVKLQIDIFGVAALRPSRSIGQNVVLFANSLDSINPMAYPSHYEPYRHHAVRPYSTVLDTVSALRRQLASHPRVKIYAYIELFNYRYPMNYATKVKYIQAQIQGAMNGGANGWYAWSARNKYNILFNILQSGKRYTHTRQRTDKRHSNRRGRR